MVTNTFSIKYSRYLTLLGNISKYITCVKPVSDDYLTMSTKLCKSFRETGFDAAELKLHTSFFFLDKI